MQKIFIVLILLCGTIVATAAVVASGTVVRLAWSVDDTGYTFRRPDGTVDGVSTGFVPGNPLGNFLTYPIDKKTGTVYLPVYRPPDRSMRYAENSKAAADQNTKVLQGILDNMPSSGGVLEIPVSCVINGLTFPHLTDLPNVLMNCTIRGATPGVNLININSNKPCITLHPQGAGMYIGEGAHYSIESLVLTSPGTALDVKNAGLHFSLKDVSIAGCSKYISANEFDRTPYAAVFKDMYGWYAGGQLKLLGNNMNGILIDNCGDINLPKITARSNLGIGVHIKNSYGIHGAFDCETNHGWNMLLENVNEGDMQVWMEQKGWRNGLAGTDEYTQGKLTGCTAMAFRGHGLKWHADTLSRLTCTTNGRQLGYVEKSDLIDETADPYAAPLGKANSSVVKVINKYEYEVTCTNYNSFSPAAWVRPLYNSLGAVKFKPGDVIEIELIVSGNESVYRDFGNSAKQALCGTFHLNMDGASTTSKIALLQNRAESHLIRLVATKETTGVGLLQVLGGSVEPKPDQPHVYRVKVNRANVYR